LKIRTKKALIAVSIKFYCWQFLSNITIKHNMADKNINHFLKLNIVAFV